MAYTTKTEYFYAINTTVPTKDRVIHVFDVDDTLTLKPHGFNNIGLTSDEYFDAAHDFGLDQQIAGYLHMLHSCGDAIAICTSRPVQRLRQTYEWLQRSKLPFDVLMASKCLEAGSSTKQRMFQMLRREYGGLGYFFDDSPYNIEGGRLQGLTCVHVPKNDEYWAAHPETVVKI